MMDLSDNKALMGAVTGLRNMTCKAVNASIFVSTGLLACALCAASPRLAAQTAPATGSADAAAPTHRFALSAGEYLWMPELASAGPVVIVISLPEQLAYVYRNGVRIGVSTISTGKPGYETPRCHPERGQRPRRDLLVAGGLRQQIPPPAARAFGMTDGLFGFN